DTHAHDLHQGRIPLMREDFFQQLEAEDLAVTIALIHMDGKRLMGRWSDLTGSPSPLSTDRHRLQYAQEFRGSFGHVGMAGIDEFVTPFIGGATNTPWAPDVLNADYLEAAREQGGIGGFMHPFNGSVATPEAVSVSEIPVDAALGLGEFYDVICYWYDELANAEMYYRLLNAGFRIAATGGTDNFSDVWRDPGPGASRTYVRVEGPVTVDGWLDGIRSLNTFATNGPLLFATVEGLDPGHEIRREAGESGPVHVEVDVASITPVSRVEVIVNGEVVHSEDTRGRTGQFSLEADVPVEGSAWVAVRALGPTSPVVSDSYAFAQTTPVWIVEGDTPYVSGTDVRFLLEAVEAFRGRVAARDRFQRAEDRAQFLARVDSAAAVYRALLREAEGRN
ncbi:MAG: CehA/McbA family metallohydrolase, partial [Gemmatimonadetes bacterium]|nr:CehA/McbA family metallohydrolase [Gemmatimonadota bacterium]